MPPKPFVFVAMPFKSELDDVYERGIKAACQAAGADCTRVDEQIFTEEILRRIYQQIESADLVIGQMTGANPNVYFEIGYAKGQRKKILLLTKDPHGIPFDLQISI